MNNVITDNKELEVWLGYMKEAQHGCDIDNLGELLSVEGLDLTDITDDKGATLLMYFAKFGQKEAADLLLDKLAENLSEDEFVAYVNAKDNDGRTALMEAAYSGHKGIVKLLLGNGADVEAKNIYGWTALMDAASSGHKKIVKLLLENGADVNAWGKYGQTALMIAAYSGHKKIVKLLLEHGADVNAKDKGGETALMDAAYSGETAIVEFLLENGANINAQNEKGKTALMFAAYSGHKETVELLLENGADPMLADNEGRTAADLARRSYYSEIGDAIEACACGAGNKAIKAGDLSAADKKRILALKRNKCNSR